MKERILLVGLLCLLSAGFIFAQATDVTTDVAADPDLVGKKCMFVCANNGAENYEYDDYIYPLLEEWGLVIDKKHEAAAVATYTAADYEGYDFIFISETAMSDDIANLKNAPLPTFNTDGWTPKEAAFAYTPGRTSGFSGEGDDLAEKVVLLEEAGDHPLAAGIAPGTVFELCSPEGLIVFTTPSIPVIKIAGMESDPSKLVVFGVEAGTQNINGVALENRMAFVTLHAWGWPTMTDEMKALYKAGIKWVLTTEEVAETTEEVAE